ncbi:hypothetical protein FN960_12900 [Alkalicoccobacillus porphyridii]|uniref:Uncharacterized protein n=1 Tax=Alkalicoccobacillus porphyridii TaxID=2597270 RepID=A0A553ZXT0_9BACI|nr:hypothetical protein FN960_12900 [Alkalicoccobacillus porphyridii]
MFRRYKRPPYYPSQKKCGPWLYIRAACYQCLLPIICFQAIRTLLFPTTLDFLLLVALIVLYCSVALNLF